MKRTVFAWTMTMTMTMAMATVAAPAWAQHGQGAGKASAGSGPHAHAAAPKSTAHGHSTTAHSTTTTTAHTKTTTAHTKTTTAHTKTTTAHSTTTSVTLSPVQQKLHQNTHLATKVQSRLPAGTNLDAASAGFRNLGQFVAAVNVSNNLGIPFAQLKTRMVDRGMSLGQAIQDARPATTDTTIVVRRAERDADDMIRTTTVTATKTTHK